MIQGQLGGRQGACRGLDLIRSAMSQKVHVRTGECGSLSTPEAEAR